MTTTLELDLQQQIDAHVAALHALWLLVDRQRPADERLTDRQMEVAVLAATSPLTMKEIARRLHMSVDTAKTHVRLAYRKLGISRRHQLAAALSRHGDAE